MKTAYAEVDASGNLRVLEKEGILKGSFRYVNTSLSDYNEPKRLIASFTDSSVMDKVYSFPKLKEKHLKLAIKQKISKDLEFIANIEEMVWIYSKFPANSGYRVLVSIMRKEFLQRFNHLKALTTTAQVISNFLTGKVEGNFIVIHSFKDDYIVIAFHNGLIDYVRTFKTENSLDDAVELTLEYYKEQRKTEITRIYCSGDLDFFQTSRFEMKPLTELVELPINEKELNFFIPFALSNSKVPYFYETSTFAFGHYAIAAFVFLLLASGIVFLKINQLNEQLIHLHKERNMLSLKVNKLQTELSKLEKEIQVQKSFQSKPEIKHFLSLKRDQVSEFLYSFYKISDRANTFVLSLSTSKNSEFELSTITFCKNLSSPIEFYRLINLIKKNPFIDNVKIIDVKEIPEKRALMADFSIKFKKVYYGKD
ncbi:hypothetical protein Dester_1450 [Desulfurobacterium thermolithotrophum DSM 11699]|uniref:Uncharacterized protein n=1 Tax=Desulfurobacterium thermolithotrophum (strain DSM 11699 / BSA) TaxID=868864 RepID=F0S1Z9_DESTD|nr:hypothetical protein [Desulfurobacterium thermolithotrophum]ADY74080.1 hypothetical protein Dester_1450 [Desulfurobacterium thermolithotrophum DSM 11699]